MLDGQEVTLKSVDHARSLGIDAVYQDLALVNQLTVYQNMFLNREKVRWPLLNNRAMRRQARQYLDEIGVQIPDINAPRRPAVRRAAAGDRGGPLGVLQPQDPAARRAAGGDGGQGGLDHPRPLLQLKDQGDVSIIIIAHNYGQVLEVCDRVNMIQDGKITFDKRSAETSPTS